MKVLLAAALLPLPALAADPPLPIALAPSITGTRLDVSAVGMVDRTPDVATVDAGVVTQARSAGDAMAANAQRMSATIAALKRAGVADRDIQTASLQLNPQYVYAENQPPSISGYQASNRVTVRLRDLARAGGVLDALVAAGANQISGPSFALDHPDEALDEARTQALAKARARAELYARAAGLRVRRIVQISESEGGGPIVRPMMAAMSLRKVAPTPIESGEQTLSVNLSVTFELQ